MLAPLLHQGLLPSFSPLGSNAKARVRCPVRPAGRGLEHLHKDMRAHTIKHYLDPSTGPQPSRARGTTRRSCGSRQALLLLLALTASSNVSGRVVQPAEPQSFGPPEDGQGEPERPGAEAAIERAQQGEPEQRPMVAAEQQFQLQPLRAGRGDGGDGGAGGVVGVGGAGGVGGAAVPLVLALARQQVPVMVAQPQDFEGRACSIAQYDLGVVTNNRGAVVAAHAAMKRDDAGWTLAGIIYTNEGRAVWGADQTILYYLEAEDMVLTKKCYEAIQKFLKLHQTELIAATQRGEPAYRVLTGWSLLLENFKQNLVPHMLVETWCKQRQKILTSLTAENVCEIVKETLATVEELLRNIQAPSSLPPSWPAHQTLAGISE